MILGIEYMLMMYDQKDSVDFTILRLNGIAFVNFINPLKKGDILVIKTRSATRKMLMGTMNLLT